MEDMSSFWGESMWQKSSTMLQEIWKFRLGPQKISCEILWFIRLSHSWNTCSLGCFPGNDGYSSLFNAVDRAPKIPVRIFGGGLPTHYETTHLNIVASTLSGIYGFFRYHYFLITGIYGDCGCRWLAWWLSSLDHQWDDQVGYWSGGGLIAFLGCSMVQWQWQIHNEDVFPIELWDFPMSR